jgi:hypothetical protein
MIRSLRVEKQFRDFLAAAWSLLSRGIVFPVLFALVGVLLLFWLLPRLHG